jgi:hypothetical protein
MTDPKSESGSEPTSESASQPDYAVGYKRPPAATQFKPGQSGNRRGRPKGAQNFSTVLEKELNSPVTVTENGRRKKVRKKDVIAKQLVNKAAGGDIKATTVLLNETRASGPAVGGGLPAVPAELAREDQLVLKSMLQRLRQNDSPVQDAPEPEAPSVRQRVQLKPDGEQA